MSPALLEARGVAGGYAADDVIAEVDVAVAKREVVFLLGPNGAGKSTLLRALSGTLARRSGAVELAGQSLAGLPPHRRARAGLVHVAEGRATLIPSLTVREHLDLVVGGTDARRADIVERFPLLAERRDQRAGTLSGGQQQLLAIALGLLAGPACLLIDEPSAGLSPLMVDAVFDVLSGLRDAGVAMLVAEQRVDLALRLADRAYALEAGRVVAEGPVRELIDSGRLDASYLGVAPAASKRSNGGP